MCVHVPRPQQKCDRGCFSSARFTLLPIAICDNCYSSSVITLRKINRFAKLFIRSSSSNGSGGWTKKKKQQQQRHTTWNPIWINDVYAMESLKNKCKHETFSSPSSNTQICIMRVRIVCMLRNQINPTPSN